MENSDKDEVIDAGKENISHRKRCEALKKSVFETSQQFKRISRAVSEVGCPLEEHHFSCEPCDSTATAYFDSTRGIVLCQNNISNEKDLENNLIHEMIHAYDWCKFKIDQTNIKHTACTEVRAASLSEDCSWYNEIRRGNFNFLKQHQICARRRAILSLSLSSTCNDYRRAEEAVDVVFSSCYRDKQPFCEE